MSAAKRFEPPNASNAILCVAASITIDCPASHAFNTLIDTAAWPQWNRFVPQIEVLQPNTEKSSPKATTLVLGSAMTFHARMKPGSGLTETKEIVTVISTPESVAFASKTSAPGSAEYSISWTAASMPRFTLVANRFNEFRSIKQQNGSEQCEYKTWEIMTGPMAYVIRTMYQTTLQERFEDWANDLKAYTEKSWSLQQNATG